MSYSVIYFCFTVGKPVDRMTVCKGRDLAYATFIAQTLADGLNLKPTNAHEVEPTDTMRAWLHQEDHTVISVSLIPTVLEQN